MNTLPFCCLNCDFWEYTAYFNAKMATMNFYKCIPTIQLTSYLNLKSVNWYYVNNQLTVQLSGFGSQP